MVISELTASAAARETMSTDGAKLFGVVEHAPSPMKNRAVHSKSSFVRSAKHSPVEWQLLDPAAIGRARLENKLLFLHIGYSACHFSWLMTQETFLNPECAAVLNESFIPVFVDREERPDIDTVYMNYLQAVNHTGGWPMNIFVTPDMEPVFGGTYWPGPSTVRRIGAEHENLTPDSLAIFKRVRDIWRDQETRCRKEAAEVLNQLREFAAEGTLGTRGLSVPLPLDGSWSLGAAPGVSRHTAQKKRAQVSSELDLDQLEEAYAHMAKTFDPVYGGFGLAPKFLTPCKLIFLFLLDAAPSAVQDVVGEAECKHATHMAVETLRKIRDGALHDHIGGMGFSRCSVTRDWSIPNFEKLVVDNSMLLTLYIRAWRLAGGKEESEFFQEVVELADYLSSPPIALPHGGIASSEAADSVTGRDDGQTREGAYYLWTRREFDSVVDASGQDKKISQVAAAHWDVQEDGNVGEEHDANDDFMKQNILRVVKTADELSKQFGLPVKTVRQYIETARERLKARRAGERIRPEIDDKVITAWNSIAISALVQASMALEVVDSARSKKYLNAAQAAVHFIRTNLWDASSQVLYRIWHNGRGIEGFADDYAYLISCLLDLFSATKNESVLEFADVLQKIQLTRFHDIEVGGFFSTPSTLPHTVIRLKEGMDASLPSTNSVAATNLLRLGYLLDDETYLALATGTINAFEVEILQHPWLFPGLLWSVAVARLGPSVSTVEVEYKKRREKV